jgi:hypothetical protein
MTRLNSSFSKQGRNTNEDSTENLLAKCNYMSLERKARQKMHEESKIEDHSH